MLKGSRVWQVSNWFNHDDSKQPKFHPRLLQVNKHDEFCLSSTPLILYNNTMNIYWLVPPVNRKWSSVTNWKNYGDISTVCNWGPHKCMQLKNIHACTLQKQMCYFSKVFGCYNCVTILILCNFMNAVIKKKIHAMGADTWINFTHIPQNFLQALHSLN